MNKQLSDLWSINNREAIKALGLAVIGAVVGLVWSGLQPSITIFINTFTIDFSPFLEAVNLNTIIKVAAAAAGPYLGFTFATGTSKVK